MSACQHPDHADALYTAVACPGCQRGNMSEPDCPECHGTRTLDGITDEASAAAWLDCTTCSAIPKQQLGVNEHGTPVSIHVCSACGDTFTVCPPASPNFGSGCLAPLCPSYDIERDVDYLLAAGQRIVRKPVGSDGGGT